MENILLGLGIILAVLGVKMIYDARPIVKNISVLVTKMKQPWGLSFWGL